MFSEDASSVNEIEKKLDVWSDIFSQRVKNSMELLAGLLKQTVVEKLSGGALQSKTGMLLANLNEESHDEGAYINASTPYAAILEYRGQTKKHVIAATQVKSLAFLAGEGTAFARQVMHPGSSIPAFSYLHNSLQEIMPVVNERLTETIVEGMEN